MKLMLIDGNSIVNRAFFGIRELNAPDGTPTNAIYGFLAILQHLYEDQKPEAVCVAFDRREPTFRHRSYDFYKAQRKPMPEELAVQMPVLKDLLDVMGVSHLELAGYEADDILGTLSRVAEEQGNDCVIVTGDKDSLQLVSDRTTVCNVKSRMGKTETILYTPERFREEYGFEPPLMVDLKALMGDSSDNIPGVPGVGEKTAMDLVRRYGGIGELYQDLDALEIKDGVRKKLAAGQDSANSSYWLATIFREVPLDCEEAECFRWSLRRTPELLAFMKRLGFRRMIDQWRLQDLDSGTGEAAAAADMAEEKQPETVSVTADELPILTERVRNAAFVALRADGGTEELELCLAEDPDRVWRLSQMEIGEGYDAFCRTLFSGDVKKTAHNVKDLMNRLNGEGLSRDGFVFDTALAAYLLRATDSGYELPDLAERYLGRSLDGAAAVAMLTPVLREKLEADGQRKPAS